jgi:hypothetical protein
LSEVIETTATSVFLDERGVLHVVSNGTMSTPETVAETVAVIHILVSRPVPALFDARKWPKAGSDTWMAIIDVLPSIVSASALLVLPDGEALLGGFPSAVNRLMLPLEVFTDESEATAFLEQFITGDDDWEEE